MPPIPPFRRVPVAVLAAALVAALAACGSGTSDLAGATPDRPDADAEPLGPATVPMPATRADGGAERAPPGGDAVPVPEAVIVSTNEPFYQARVEGGTLVLTGVGFEARTLSIESSDFAGGMRMIRARDAEGTVEAGVRAVECEDDMSGAEFPLTGTLTVGDSGPHRGCARPADMPPPREPGMAHHGQARASLPPALQGRWAPDAEACRDPASTIEGIRVTSDEIRFHESTGVARHVETDAEGASRVRFDFEGEGERWEAAYTLRIDENGALQLMGPDDTAWVRVRCEG